MTFVEKVVKALRGKERVQNIARKEPPKTIFVPPHHEVEDNRAQCIRGEFRL